MELGGAWTREEASASGQVFEFRLWALLTEQSRGRLHVFLPLADRGIDAMLHRRTDDVYLAVQAKGRSALMDGEVHLVVWADSLRDDDALLVSGLLTEGGLGPTMLVAPEGEFKRLAELSTWDSRPVYSMGFGMTPRSNSRWLPYLVPTERLAERLGVSAALEAAEELSGDRRDALGFLGESEVIRLLAEDSELNLFRCFPDLETSELVARHLTSKAVIGLQIKTIGVDVAHPIGTVSVLASSFRPCATTHFVMLAWRRDVRRFDDECLVIPSLHFDGVAQLRGVHMSFDWHPGLTSAGRLGGYRASIRALPSVVTGRMSI
jgi:hypothetical protein